jgi:AraC-like DNA-binding protein
MTQYDRGRFRPTMVLWQSAADVEHWRHLISDTFVPLEPTVPVERGFRGVVEAVTTNEIAVLRVDSVAQHVRRTPVGCRREPADLIKVLVQRRGHALVQQDEQRSVLPSQALTVYDTGRPYLVTQCAPFTTDVVLIPRARLQLSGALIAAVQRRPVATDTGAGALFVSYLDALRVRFDECSDSAAEGCLAVLLELLGAALSDVAASALPSAPLRTSVLAWISRHLSDEDLSAPVIAAANGISVRYLHRLFESSGTSVSRYVRGERLRHIRADLVNPLYRNRTIGTIGARWGIVDPARLSRLFRQAYGLSPGDLRGSPAVRA